MPGEAGPGAAVGDGITPTLAELVALRDAVVHPHAARRGHHGACGPAPSPLRGRGMEYAESRDYVAGDDARHIDWRLTARTGRAHTKLFQAERERLTLIVADTSPALYFGTRVRFKSVQAARAGAVAAWTAVRAGDRVAALRGSRREAPVAPAAGARGALRVLDALARWYARAPADDAGLAVGLDHAQRLLRPDARLVVLAEPGSVAAMEERRLMAMGRRHEVTVLLLTDPLETAPPHAMLPFESSGRRVDLDLAAQSRRQRWHQQFAAPSAATIDSLAAHGVRALALSTDAASESWLPWFGRARLGRA